MPCHEDLKTITHDYIYGDQYSDIYAKDIRNLETLNNLFKDLLSVATLDQLWAIYRRFILGNCLFLVVSVIPNDHIGLQYNGLYFAILPDGSIHT